MTTLATADLRTQVETAIWRLMTPPAEGGLGLTLRAATIRLASLTYRRALDSGRTLERATAMGRYVTQVGRRVALVCLRAEIMSEKAPPTTEQWLQLMRAELDTPAMAA